MNHNLYGIPLDNEAITVIRTFAPAEPLLVAYSGGKDSVVIRDLVERAGVPHVLQYYLTPLEPPELRQFAMSAPGVEVLKPRKRLLDVAARKRILPTRTIRWCCEIFKEHSFPGRTVVLGVRRKESQARSGRKTVESCRRMPGMFFLNPIIDWSTADVWQYIRERALPYCSLYDEGHSRLGCVGCPMQGREERIAEMERWPAAYRLWRRVLDCVYHQRLIALTAVPLSKNELWQWWLNGDMRLDEMYGENEDAANWLF